MYYPNLREFKGEKGGVTGWTYGSGQLYFTTNMRSVLSNTIAFFENDEEMKREKVKTHVGVVISAFTGIEATPFGMRMVNLQKYFDDDGSIIEFRTPRAIVAGAPDAVALKHYFLRYARNMAIDKSRLYDYPGLLAMMICEAPIIETILSEEAKKKIFDLLEIKDWFFCSEAMTYIAYKCGFTNDIDKAKSPLALWKAEWILPEGDKRLPVGN